jgi:hypothetical protein
MRLKNALTRVKRLRSRALHVVLSRKHHIASSLFTVQQLQRGGNDDIRLGLSYPREPLSERQVIKIVSNWQQLHENRERETGAEVETQAPRARVRDRRTERPSGPRRDLISLRMPVPFSSSYSPSPHSADGIDTRCQFSTHHASRIVSQLVNFQHVGQGETLTTPVSRGPLRLVIIGV